MVYHLLLDIFYRRFLLYKELLMEVSNLNTLFDMKKTSYYLIEQSNRVYLLL